MPNLVVDLINFDKNTQEIIEAIDKYKESMLSDGFVILSHDIDREKNNIISFKEELYAAIVGEVYKCAEIQENGNEKPLLDKYGNTFFSKPFDYSYVELRYGSYKKILEVRLLGNVAGIPVRFYIENVEHKISPTSFKILENIDFFIKKDWVQQTVEFISDSRKKLDQLCETSKKIDNDKSIEWRQVFETILYPQPYFKKQEITKDSKEYFNNYKKRNLKKSNSIVKQEDVKQSLDTFLENQKESSVLLNNYVETRVGPKDENPVRGTSQDSSKKDGKQDECESEKVALSRPSDSERLQKELVNISKRLQDFKRKYSIQCIAKETFECLIPPNTNLCDIIFKDPNPSMWFKHLSFLKSSRGLAPLHDIIISKIEDDIGITELRKKQIEIKNLKKLINEEEELLDILNDKKMRLEEEITAVVQELRAVSLEKSRLSVAAANLTGESRNNTLLRANNRLSKQADFEAKLKRLQIDLEYLGDIGQGGSIGTLSQNLKRHRDNLLNLENQYGEKIAELKYNEKQSDLIRRGENLQAVLEAAEEGQIINTETILNAIDSVVPLENLCAVIFQSLITGINFQIPENFFEGIQSKFNFSDPFKGIYFEFNYAILNFVTNAILSAIDSFLSSLCTDLNQTISLSSQNEWETLTNKISQKADNFERETINAIDLSTIATIGFEKQNTRINMGLEKSDIEKNSQESSKIFPSIPTIDFTSDNNIVSFFSTGISSPFAEWNVSVDKKTFIYDTPPLLDFSQWITFLQTTLRDELQISVESGKISYLGLKDMNSPRKEEGTNFSLSEPEVITTPITIEQATSELKCLLNRISSLVPPSDALDLFTGNPSEQTKLLVLSLAEICAPNMLERYPGTEFIPALIGQIGKISGAEKFKEKIVNVQINNDLPEITKKVVCERFDNTKEFIAGLMSKTISRELAEDILNKIEEKRIQDFSRIVNNITSINQGSGAIKEQNASQMYLDMIDQIIQAEKAGSSITNISDIKNNNIPVKQDNLKQILSEKNSQITKTNVFLKNMIEKTSDSLFRPIKRSFDRDMDSYINILGGKVKVKKQVSPKKKVEIPGLPGGAQVIDPIFKSYVDNNSVPALKIESGTISVTSPQLIRDLKEELDQLNNSIENIEQNFNIIRDLSQIPQGQSEPAFQLLFRKIAPLENEILNLLRLDLKDNDFRWKQKEKDLQGCERFASSFQLNSLEYNDIDNEEYEQTRTAVIAAGSYIGAYVGAVVGLFAWFLGGPLVFGPGGAVVGALMAGKLSDDLICGWKRKWNTNLTDNPVGENLEFLLEVPWEGNSWVAEETSRKLELYEANRNVIINDDRDTVNRKFIRDKGFIPIYPPSRYTDSFENPLDDVVNEEEWISKLKQNISSIRTEIATARASYEQKLRLRKQEIEELLEISKPFSRSNDSKIEKVMLPSFVMPFQKQLDGSNSIKSTVPLGIPFVTGTIEITAPIFGQPLYISDGYVEQQYSEPFIDEEEIPLYIDDYVVNIGQKFADSLIDISSNIEVVIDDKTTSISFESKHSSLNNPLLEVLEKLSLAETNNIGIQRMLEEENKIDFSCILKDLLENPDNISNISSQFNFSKDIYEKMKDSIPLWKFSFNEYVEEDKIETNFNLKTTGLSFLPNGENTKFYHDTNISKLEDLVEEKTQQYIIEKYGKQLGRKDVFKRHIQKFISRDFFDINYSFDAMFKNFPSIDIPNLRGQQFNPISEESSGFSYEFAVSNLLSRYSNKFLNNRLLQLYQSEQDLSKNLNVIENKNTKLIEIVDFVRKQTQFEKENKTDPNIMDFERLKKLYSKFIDSFEDDELTDKQLKGEASVSNNVTKTSDVINLITFVDLCIVEHILKSIFVYDQFTYSEKLADYKFLLKDLSKFILQEAKRNKIGKEIHKNANLYLEYLEKQKTIELPKNHKKDLNKWNEKNSYSDIEPSPSFLLIVKHEFKKVLKKFSRILQCNKQLNESTDLVISDFISGLELYDIPLISENNQWLEPRFNDQNLFKKGSIYLERYVKLGKVNKQNIPKEVFGELHGPSVTSRRREWTYEELSESKLDLWEFRSFIATARTEGILEKVIPCKEDSEESNPIFDSNPRFGLRIVMTIDEKSFSPQSAEISEFDFANIKIQKNEVFKTRSYATVIDPGLEVFLLFNSLTLAEQEIAIPFEEVVDPSGFNPNFEDLYTESYYNKLLDLLISSSDCKVLFNYSLLLQQLIEMIVINSNLSHNDQDGRFLFEGTKILISKMQSATNNFGNSSGSAKRIQSMADAQVQMENNTGNPLGPSLEALKFFYRTPIQMLKGLSTIVDPNIALADKIVQGGAMAGSLGGIKTVIPYSAASLALLPFPLFNGVTPPYIPPLTSYNVGLPIGPIFLGLEPLLYDLPWYQNNNKENSTSEKDGSTLLKDSNNPFFCEIIPEENEE